MQDTRPFIGVPMGDPAGIGPEIILKSMCLEAVYSVARPVVIGHAGVIRRLLTLGLKPDPMGAADSTCTLEIREISHPDEGNYTCGVINIISAGTLDANTFGYGRVQAECGRFAYDCIVKAVELAKIGQIAALATTPINKEAIKAAKVDFIGHTEMLSGLTGTADPLTMFQVYGLRVFFLSRHVSLRKACDMVTTERLTDYLQKCNQALVSLGIPNGHIAVAGLNPHCGEHGLFGDEEVVQIEPAVAAARHLGMNVSGPLPADSVFHMALKGKYDAVLSLYHDQGHIATKMVDFERTISVTIGLPFIRTSVDHGTAFDIAGKGIASAVSMAEAIRLAAGYSAL